MRLVLTFALGLLALSAQARLGETEKEVDTRYGEPKTRVDKDLPAGVAYRQRYEFGVFTVWVWFREFRSFGKPVVHRSVYESYAAAGRGPISDEDLANLLKANAGGKDWGDGTTTKEGPKGHQTAAATTVWRRDDGKFVAAYHEAVFDNAGDYCYFEVMLAEYYTEPQDDGDTGGF